MTPERRNQLHGRPPRHLTLGSKSERAIVLYYLRQMAKEGLINKAHIKGLADGLIQLRKDLVGDT